MGLRVAVLFLGAAGCLAAFVLWHRLGDRPPTHELCVAQAEHRFDLMFGDGLAAEANAHPSDYARLRTNMITTCESYWTHAYVRCLIEARTLAATDACEAVGRVRRPSAR
jgi:hypothetical protein